MVSELPTPGVTPRRIWAEMVNEAINSRYNENVQAIAANAAAITALEPQIIAGTELDYAERVANYTTTAAAPFGPPIDTLQAEAVGSGRPVDVEFFAANVFHSVANTLVNAYLVVDGIHLDDNGQLASVASPSTIAGPSLYFKKRIVLDDGVPYQFNVVMFAAAAGTSTIVAANFAPNFLSVTSR